MTKIATNTDIINNIVNKGYLVLTDSPKNCYPISKSHSKTIKLNVNPKFNSTTTSSSQSFYYHSYIHGKKNMLSRYTYTFENYAYNYFSLTLSYTTHDAYYFYYKVIAAYSSHTFDGNNGLCNYFPIHELGKAANSSTITIEANDTIMIPGSSMYFNLNGCYTDIFDGKCILQKSNGNKIIISPMTDNTTTQFKDNNSSKFNLNISIGEKKSNEYTKQLSCSFIPTGSAYTTWRSNSASNRKSSESNSSLKFTNLTLPKNVYRSNNGIIDLGYFYCNYYHVVEAASGAGATIYSNLGINLKLDVYELRETNKKYILGQTPIKTINISPKVNYSGSAKPRSVTQYRQLHLIHLGINLFDLYHGTSEIAINENTTNNVKTPEIYANYIKIGKFISETDYILACSIEVTTDLSSVSIISKDIRDTALGIGRSTVMHTISPGKINNAILSKITNSSEVNTLLKWNNGIGSTTFNSNGLAVNNTYSIYTADLSSWCTSAIHTNFNVETQYSNNYKNLLYQPSVDDLKTILQTHVATSNILYKCPTFDNISPTYFYNANIVPVKTILPLVIPTTNKLVKMDSIGIRCFPKSFNVKIYSTYTASGEIIPQHSNASKVTMANFTLTFSHIELNTITNKYDIYYANSNYAFKIPSTNTSDVQQVPDIHGYIIKNYIVYSGQYKNNYVIFYGDQNYAIDSANNPYRGLNVFDELNELYGFYNVYPNKIYLSDILDGETIYAFDMTRSSDYVKINKPTTLIGDLPLMFEEIKKL